MKAPASCKPALNRPSFPPPAFLRDPFASEGSLLSGLNETFPKGARSKGTPGRARRYEREAQAIPTRGMVIIGDLRPNRRSRLRDKS